MSHPYHNLSCGCDHDTLDQAQLETLYPQIDNDRLVGYNESQIGSIKRVIRPYEERKSSGEVSSSEDDAELGLLIPFVTNVKIRCITIKSHGDTAPNKVKIYVNRDDLNLSTAADTVPTQELDLQPDPDAELDIPLKQSKFQNVSSLFLYFPSNYSTDSPDSSTSIQWLHFKGVASQDKRQVPIVVYEAIARPSDHKVKGEEQGVGRSIE